MPILKGRDGDATDKQKERGDQAQKDLLTKVNKFIIRRTNDLLSKYRKVSSYLSFKKTGTLDTSEKKRNIADFF